MMFGVGDSNPKAAEDAYAPTYYPGTADASQASVIEVKPGDDILGVTFRLGRTHAVRVSGVVRGADGEPLKGAMVQLFPRARGAFTGMDMLLRATDDKGAFNFTGVMPGAYVAFVRGA